MFLAIINDTYSVVKGEMQQTRWEAPLYNQRQNVVFIECYLKNQLQGEFDQWLERLIKGNVRRKPRWVKSGFNR
jgi:hypothetical protein